MCAAGGGELDEVVFSLPCFSRQLITELDQTDFANNFRGGRIDPLCLYINKTFHPLSTRAVCCPDRTDEAVTTYFHIFRQTESLSWSLSCWMFISCCRSKARFTKEVYRDHPSAPVSLVPVAMPVKLSTAWHVSSLQLERTLVYHRLFWCEWPRCQKCFSLPLQTPRAK